MPQVGVAEPVRTPGPGDVVNPIEQPDPRLLEPVRQLPIDRSDDVEDTMALCLSGGGYLGIRSDVVDYGLPSSLPAPHEATLRLAAIPKRLAAMEEREQLALINWGYVISDAAIRRHLEPESERPAAVPYPDSWVG